MSDTSSLPVTATPIDELAHEAIALVETWLAQSRDQPVDAAAARLAGVLRDPNGLAFTVGFVDGVVRPEDLAVAARNLRALGALIPRFLPLPLRALIRVGGLTAPMLPRVVVPAARAALRRMVRHLIVDATDARLGTAIKRLRSPKVRLNVNLLGEAILGEAEAVRRLAGTERLLRRPDVDYVSIKVSSTVAPHSTWSFDDAVTAAIDALRPLYRLAAARATGGKFINLDMEEYKDLDLTLAVFTGLLDEPEFRDLEAGIVLQAYLPDALGAMMRLQTWATARVDAGGAPIKVRVVKGANLPMEQVDADLHGWPLATWHSKQATDASYKAVLDYALRPEHTRAVRIGVAGHNLFDIALAWLLAGRRGVEAGIDVEMLLGMATAQAAVVREEVGSLLLYTPVVHPAEFDVAIAYLVRRLEEGASQENFMSAVFDLGSDRSLFERERDRFLASLADMPTEAPAPNRVQNRTLGVADVVTGFTNTPDTDTSIAHNRAWATEIRSRMQTTTLGSATVDANTVGTAAELDARIAVGVDAGASWRALGAAGRAEVLHRAGVMLERRRADLLEVMGAECGKVLEQGDPEVSEAIDFAHYYAERGADLEVAGATARPAALTVVTPPWNFPVAIPAGSTLAALAAGSPVIIKPARAARRSGAVMIEALWEAGVPRDVLQYVQLADRALGDRLIGDERVERVVLTGGYETAEHFHRVRPSVRLLGETSGKNAIIVTPDADLDLAAKDVAASAFGHAGQKCSAASLVILVGSVARSKRFRRQLIDAVRSYRVGSPWEEASQVGPLIAPADGKLLDALTSLEPGQRWVLEPRRLDDDGRLWTPGIRAGVMRGSEYHRTEYFGPVLGVMTAETLSEAIAVVNEIDYGLTSGLHSLDQDEIDTWLASIEAGNLYVNRGITGAIVQRQPFGGWRKASVGGSAKAGGPNYLFALTDWDDAPLPTGATDALSESVLTAATASGLSADDVQWLRGALGSDIDAVRDEFATARDVTGLTSEHNVFRYHPTPVTVRIEGALGREHLRTIAAGLRIGAPLTIGSTSALPAALAGLLAKHPAVTVLTDDVAWARHLARLAVTGGRLRAPGADRTALSVAIDGSPAVALLTEPVVSAGRVELLAFVKEQAVSITAHRFGTPRSFGVPPTIAR